MPKTDIRWWEIAECKGMDTEVFFPKHNEYAKPRAVCKDCKVQQECLLSTLYRDNDNYGMFGGLTPAERWELRKQMGLA
jgi:hypothetical protein